MRQDREKSQYLGSTAMKDSEGRWSQRLVTERKKEKVRGKKQSLNILIVMYNLLLLQLQCNRYTISCDPAVFPFLACG